MSDFVPPPQEQQKTPRSRDLGTPGGAPERRGSSSGVKQRLRTTDGFDAQDALLTPRENATNGAARDTAFERTGRGKHEWRVSLLSARNHMGHAAKESISERSTRDLEALKIFETTMKFAAAESTLSLAVGGVFNTLTGLLPSPLSAVKTSFELVGDIYSKAADAARGARLDVWIEAHRDAANEMRERDLSFEDTKHAWIESAIDKLVDDESDQGERRKQEWELAMLKVKFPVRETTQQFEHHLYERWCREVGAHFSVNLYRTDRRHPGDEEVGSTDQNHPAFGGRQVHGMNIPDQILDRLGRQQLDPTRELSLPVEHRHHEREPGTGRWVGRKVTRFDRDEEPRR